MRFEAFSGFIQSVFSCNYFFQTWALNALALTAESGGPMFREFVQPSLNLVLRLLLKTPSTVTDIHNSLANLLGALITTLGPDLQCKYNLLFLQMNQ